MESGTRINRGAIDRACLVVDAKVGRNPSTPKGRTFRRRDGALSELGVRRDKAALSSGCKSDPAITLAGNNRSGHGGNETLRFTCCCVPRGRQKPVSGPYAVMDQKLPLAFETSGDHRFLARSVDAVAAEGKTTGRPCSDDCLHSTMDATFSLIVATRQLGVHHAKAESGPKRALMRLAMLATAAMIPWMAPTSLAQAAAIELSCKRIDVLIQTRCCSWLIWLHRP